MLMEYSPRISLIFRGSEEKRMVSRGKVNILDKLVACTAIFCLVLSFSFKPVFGADAPTEGTSGGENLALAHQVCFGFNWRGGAGGAGAGGQALVQGWSGSCGSRSGGGGIAGAIAAVGLGTAIAIGVVGAALLATAVNAKMMTTTMTVRRPTGLPLTERLTELLMEHLMERLTERLTEPRMVRLTGLR